MRLREGDEDRMLLIPQLGYTKRDDPAKDLR